MTTLNPTRSGALVHASRGLVSEVGAVGMAPSAAQVNRRLHKAEATLVTIQASAARVRIISDKINLATEISLGEATGAARRGASTGGRLRTNTWSLVSVPAFLLDQQARVFREKLKTPSAMIEAGNCSSDGCNTASTTNREIWK